MFIHLYTLSTFALLRLLVMALSLLLWLPSWAHSALPADEKTPLIITVQAYQTKEITQATWQPIIEKINQDLRTTELSLQVAFLDELFEIVTTDNTDFFFANPVAYVNLAVQKSLSSPLVSLTRLVEGDPMRSFGGVIVTRGNSQNPLTLADLAHSRIAVPSLGAFGGYVMQMYELQELGIPLQRAHIIETGMPHRLAIERLMSGQADAAFVRTGIIEQLIQEGALSANDIQVLNPKSVAGFKQSLSTRLYPEWPLSAMPHVHHHHASEVTAAFLSLPYADPVLVQSELYGFSIPVDYEGIRQLMISLKVPPYDVAPPVTLHDIWASQKNTLLLGMAALLIILMMATIIAFYNYRLSQSLTELKNNEEDLRIAAVAFETQKAILISDTNENIIRVNQAFCDITGYKSDEVIGQTPRLFKSGKHSSDFYKAIWQTINSKGSWQGEIYNKRKNGELYPTYQVINAIKNNQGEVTHYLFSFTDITEQKRNERNIYEMAFYDPLTGLANRRLLESHIHQALSGLERSRKHCALMFIDLDHFKHLNDSLGHKFGDELLKKVAQRLKQCVRKEDIVARPGGDEFIILIENLSLVESEAATQALSVANKIVAKCNIPHTLNKTPYVVTASIGIHIFSYGLHTAVELMKRADLAMYQAKAHGRNSVHFFDPQLEDTVEERREIEHSLRKAITHNQFVLYFQPKVNYLEELQGYEALIRWNHPEKGLISPLKFIPIAEETGLIIKIGEWVINQACQTLKKWQADPNKQQLILAINVSVKQFRQADFADKLIAKLKLYELDPNLLELEITESMLMDQLDDTIAKMDQLRQFGVRFALDDFGTGYSSLSYLKNLPLGCLKVDQSFVRDMLVDQDDAAIVETIIALAKTLKLQVIAEGVENPEQAAMLNQLGCDLLQGYLYSKPMPLNHYS